MEWNKLEYVSPENIGNYLCITNDDKIMVCFVAANGWWSKIPDAKFYGDMGDRVVINGELSDRAVTHWMPLPEAPKE